MEFTKTQKSFSLSLGGFFVAFIAEILSNGSLMNAILPDPINKFWYSTIAAGTVSVLIIVFGVLLDVSDFIYDGFKWRNYFKIIPSLKEKFYISQIVYNKDKQPKVFFCLLKSIKHDGKDAPDLFLYAVEHTHRISWSSGDFKGLKEGECLIDKESNGTLNIVSITKNKLTFQMAKGERVPNCQPGKYDIELEINRQKNTGSFIGRRFWISIDYYVQDDGVAKIHLFE